ncbi:succinate---hydroxymethylglutarate CoA-transferase [Mytilus galloprovincialis]|uniref:Succinate---hydroxymethylglutarate CoA-transferase n=1 Tax=Mytilus galloprovincialis TaxID=29158 RepID=A0A8B6DGU9_MYTGA|nr:succinate---hydroxymethylglutarate CoA-transferase [Mytilus galloprovincialis]
MSKVLCTFTSNQDSTTNMNQNTIQPGDSTTNLNNVDTIPDDDDDYMVLTLHNDMILEMDHSIAGKVKVPGKAVKYSERQMESTLPPPTLGQHTDEILQNMLNLSETDIKSLKDKKVIQ